jgi:hypothetical protein
MLAAACGSSSTNPAPTVNCGAGTTLQGDTCVPDGTGSNTTTCGTGTHLDGTMCVADGSGTPGAPTIMTMTPSDSGVTGFVLFQILGTNLAGSDVSQLHVYFGTNTAPSTSANPNPCEAEVAAADPTTIAGEVPPMCTDSDLNTTVTVVTDKGMATTPFHYDALFAIDGLDPNQTTQQGGFLWIIDPFAALASPWAIPNDGTNAYSFDSIAFDSAGVLWGTTTGVSPADTGGAVLATISLADGTVTPHGASLTDGFDDYIVSDLKWSGTTLYGWGYDLEAGIDSLVTIDATSGTVTPIGAGETSTTVFSAGLAVDGTGVLWATPGGASTDTSFTAATGELDTVDTTSGAPTLVQTLDWGIGSPIDSMDFIGTTLVAVVDNGVYGLDTTQKFYGTSLVAIDPTIAPNSCPAGAGCNIRPIFELPAQTANQSIVSGIAMAPATTSIARRVPQLHWTKLAAGHAVSR